MSSNADGADWRAAGYDGNRVPGDVIANAALQGHYKTLAGNFRQMADTINRIADGDNDGFEGKWTAAFGGKARDLASDLNDFGVSADAVSDALVRWQPELQAHIDDAIEKINAIVCNRNVAASYHDREDVGGAWREAQLAKQSLQAAEGTYETDSATLKAKKDDADRAYERADSLQRRYQSYLDDADEDKAALDEIIEQYNADSEDVASRIDRATDDCVPSDFWDFTYASTWRRVADFVGEASKWVGVFAMFVGFLSAVVRLWLSRRRWRSRRSR